MDEELLEMFAREYGGRTERSLDWVNAYERVKDAPLSKVAKEDINKAVIPSDKLMQFYASHNEGKTDIALLSEFEDFLLRKIRYIQENTQKAVYGKRTISDEWFDTIKHPQNNVAQYTEQFETLTNKWAAFRNAKTLPEKVIAFDNFIATVHGTGSMAGWFIEGGAKTLDNIRDIPNLTEVVLPGVAPKVGEESILIEEVNDEPETQGCPKKFVGGKGRIQPRAYPSVSHLLE